MSFKDVQDAKERISKYIHKTPVMTCSYIDQIVGRQVYFKCEQFQKTGSFKCRGALNAVLKLKERDPNSPGVVTQSSGNHGQGMAWAATTAGVPSSVVVPNDTPKVKCDAIRGYGAQLYFCEPNPVSRMETCNKISKEKGQLYIPSSNHPDVMSAQGTMAIEFLEDVPDLDALFVSVCGGGLAAGCSLAVKAIRPQCKVYVVEPFGKELGPCMKTGERLWSNPPQYVDTIADGCREQQVDPTNFPIFLKNVEKDIFTVKNEDIVEAMKIIWHRMKVVIEPSAAATVAAVLSEKMKSLDPSIKKVGVVLCGGNVDLENLPWFKTQNNNI